MTKRLRQATQVIIWVFCVNGSFLYAYRRLIQKSEKRIQWLPSSGPL